MCVCVCECARVCVCECVCVCVRVCVFVISFTLTRPMYTLSRSACHSGSSMYHTFFSAGGVALHYLYIVVTPYACYTVVKLLSHS
jgi:hypothetical protein